MNSYGLQRIHGIKERKHLWKQNKISILRQVCSEALQVQDQNCRRNSDLFMKKARANAAAIALKVCRRMCLEEIVHELL